jgi:hypothetical protein
MVPFKVRHAGFEESFAELDLPNIKQNKEALA